jgi:hypothetical protein
MKRYVSRSLLLLAVGIVLYVGYSAYFSSAREDEFAPTGIVGVQHLGHDYNISEFYVNKYNGTNVGREGGGGGSVCCIMIPVKWHPGLIVEVRWEVADWSHENRKEIAAGNFNSVTTKGMYIAKVPVEKYEVAGDVFVHFFPQGRVRVVSTMYSVLSSLHPVSYGPTDGGPMATAGLPIKEMFTPSELRERGRRVNPWK